MPVRPGFLGAVAWSPSQLSGLLSWHDASNSGSITQAAGLVSSWADLSGNGRTLAQATGANQPAYSATGFDGTRPAISFDGVAQYLFASSAWIYAAGGAAVFLAIKAATPGSTKAIMGEGRSTNATGQYSVRAVVTTGSVGIFEQNDAGTTLVLNDALKAGCFNGSPHIVASIDTGTGVRGYLDGVAGSNAGLTRSGTLSVDRFALGAVVRNTVAFGPAMTVGEMIIGPPTISAGDTALVFAYMRAKWGTP